MTIEPVVREIQVPVEPAVAFRRFTDEMNHWWPRASHSVALERCREVRFGGGEGAPIVEVDDNGAQCEWGVVRVWDPPLRVVFSWHPGRPAEQAQEIEVTFAAEGAATRVRLEHRGWEALGGEAAPVRDGYANGWVGVLGRFEASLGG